MLRKYLVLSLLLFVGLISDCQNLTIQFNYGCFATPDGQSYVETYLMIPQKQLKQVNVGDNIYNSAASVTIVFKDNDKIVNFLKYELNGIPTSDTAAINNNIIDQQRLFLDNATYLIEITVKDKNDTSNYVNGSLVISLNMSKDVVCSSSICLIDNYYKSTSKSMITRGVYDMIPYFSNFYPESKSKLTYYNEIYHLDKILGDKAKMAVFTYIEDYENAGHVVPGTALTQVGTVEPVVCLLKNIDISRLSTGNYWLIVCIKDEYGNEVIKTKKFFQRQNDAYEINNENLASLNISTSFADRFTNIDTLRQTIMTFMPKATLNERDFISKVKKNNDEESLKKFIVMFWSERDEDNPEQAFNNYMREVQKVNKTYGNSIRKGYDTDRGRVFLQYGPPDHVERNVISAGTLPYEIWQYYQIAGQRNKRFVFASQDAATKDYDLVHSDVFGELNNPKWQYDLYHNAPIINDDSEYEEMWGTPLQRTYDDPY